MRLDADDFELFDLPRQFAQDPIEITARWRALQGEVHPDRFAAQGAAAQRLAMQWAVRVNEAQLRLKDPVKRAAYLCELAGISLQAESNTAMPTGFLLQQLEWREALEGASKLEAVKALAAEVSGHRTQQIQALQKCLDERQDHTQAAQLVRALMFVERFSEDVDQRLETLEQ